ncbi:hypothetical protein [Aurantiacibacter poecillastricola]|uniref:hypothetical protein n=1 Tax=Aurantiacibacter poecillastricola TaxID=3064385 RepID=UPI00273E6BB8|nr:hypothetical protein [Aurantiacibacter sp. 219JJ12-13]MDP5262761.1 hypothetical protein [Aurantiacibacter sp. 219JJ12-13]
MQRYQVSFDHGNAEEHSLDVPDLVTALVVADINLTSGTAQILEGEKVLARIEKRGNGSSPYWHVS